MFIFLWWLYFCYSEIKIDVSSKDALNTYSQNTNKPFVFLWCMDEQRISTSWHFRSFYFFADNVVLRQRFFIELVTCRELISEHFVKFSKIFCVNTHSEWHSTLWGFNVIIKFVWNANKLQLSFFSAFVQIGCK